MLIFIKMCSDCRVISSGLWCAGVGPGARGLHHLSAGFCSAAGLFELFLLHQFRVRLCSFESMEAEMDRALKL